MLNSHAALVTNSLASGARASARGEWLRRRVYVAEPARTAGKRWKGRRRSSFGARGGFVVPVDVSGSAWVLLGT